MVKILKILVIGLAVAGFGCKGGCSVDSIKDKAMQYKDKVKPDQLDKLKEKSKDLKSLF